LAVIIAGTVCAGVGSVLLAAVLARALLARFTQHLLSLSAGALLATAFLHLLARGFRVGDDASAFVFDFARGLGFFLARQG
jgi:zinc and cadmium transporter